MPAPETLTNAEVDGALAFMWDQPKRLPREPWGDQLVPLLRWEGISHPEKCVVRRRRGYLAKNNFPDRELDCSACGRIFVPPSGKHTVTRCSECRVGKRAKRARSSAVKEQVPTPPVPIPVLQYVGWAVACNNSSGRPVRLWRFLQDCPSLGTTELGASPSYAIAGDMLWEADDEVSPFVLRRKGREVGYPDASIALELIANATHAGWQPTKASATPEGAPARFQRERTSAPIDARSDQGALFELLASLGCTMPKDGAR